MSLFLRGSFLVFVIFAVMAVIWRILQQLPSIRLFFKLDEVKSTEALSKKTQGVDLNQTKKKQTDLDKFLKEKI